MSMDGPVHDCLDPAAHVDVLRRTVDEGLAKLLEKTERTPLFEPIAHILSGSGKRFRPLLVLLSAEAFGISTEKALPAGLAVEVFHNFTLVHDDIMDNAPTRRGIPTVHEKWDQSTAILTGDLLLALSYNLLAEVDAVRLPAIMRRYYEMISDLCRGQALDKAFEDHDDVTLAQYLDMIDAKTGALVETCLEMGALLAGASDDAVSLLGSVGRHVGRAFQIQDDLLDLVADDTRWGKTIGGDLLEGKKTFLVLLALERGSSDDRAWFRSLVRRKGITAEEVPEARARLERAGVLDAAACAVREHTQAALDLLQSLPTGPGVETISWLIRTMQARAH